VIFSFLKHNPTLNAPLLSANDTTTIFAKVDQLVPVAQASTQNGIMLASNQFGTTNSSTPNTTTIQENVIVKTNPADIENFSRHGTTTYDVKAGDSIVSIASSFGISPQTIMIENKLDETSKIKPGQQLTILPTTGISLTIKESDTMEAILKKYKITEDDFLDANNLETFDDLDIGAVVVIPMDSVSMPAKPKSANPVFVKNESNKVALKQAESPADLIKDILSFIWPTTVRTITQGFSSRHTGLDISNSQKIEIYAAEDGFVELSGYQANGYGNTIVINHGNGFKTRYGHASVLKVTAGQYVVKGQVIAIQGNTGRVRGATGIHLHFEIIKNGKKVNPLVYVKP
jgi:murein DD-endopeptidase MepM/ murein hydrolase activator NlpD